MSRYSTLTGILPSEVTEELGTDHDTLAAIVRAERYGVATVHGATITHDGYQDGATSFNAATALYKVRY